jgi:hypothetical protein
VSREASDRRLEDLARSIEKLQMWVMILGLLMVLLVLLDIVRDPAVLLDPIALLLIGVAILIFLALWDLQTRMKQVEGAES